MCGGHRSRLGFTDTYSVQPVDWLLVVLAEGYQKPEMSYVNEPGGRYRGKAIETGPRQAKLVIPIALRKSVL